MPQLKNEKTSVNTEVFRKAGEEIRTLDPQLGKLMLYQLSYARIL